MLEGGVNNSSLDSAQNLVHILLAGQSVSTHSQGARLAEEQPVAMLEAFGGSRLSHGGFRGD